MVQRHKTNFLQTAAPALEMNSTFRSSCLLRMLAISPSCSQHGKGSGKRKRDTRNGKRKGKGNGQKEKKRDR